MTTLHQTEVDGVPTFWVDSGRPTISASLIFRAGQADMTLPTTGWLHLVEHLCLRNREATGLSVNGSVGLYNTSLDLHGPEEAVVTALHGIIDWLREPQLDRAQHEAGVLRAESEYRGIGDAAGALLQRFGARGPGLTACAEPGLGRVDAALLRELIARTFTTGNAALAMDRPPPSSLRLPLPGGERWPSVSGLPGMTPAETYAYLTGNSLVLSGAVPRSRAAMFVPEVLADLLHRDLREAAGGAYAQWGNYHAITADQAVVVAGTDVATSLLPTVFPRTMDAFAHLKHEGPKPGVVEDLVASAVQALHDPHNAPGAAWQAAHAVLWNRPVLRLEETIAETEAVTADQVHEAIVSFGSSLLIGFPGSAKWRKEVPLLRMPSTMSPVDGRTFRSRNRPPDRSRLVVADDAVHMTGGTTWHRIKLDELAGVISGADGARRLISHDGWNLDVEPTLWRRGAQAVERIDALVPAVLVMPSPGRQPEDIPRPRPLPARLAGMAKNSALMWLFVLLIAVTVLGVVLTRRVEIIRAVPLLVIGAVWGRRLTRRR